MIQLARFRPKIISALRDYSTSHFIKDLSSGITVGLIALPLAIAFAIASGLKPEAGLIAGVVGGFLISALGGSKVQIGGPAGAFVVIVYGIVEQYGYANLILSTFLAGLLLITMGLFRVGNLIRFIPVAIIIGFTSGIAVLIGVSQIKDALGLPIDKLPADLFSQIHILLMSLPHTNPYALLMCALTLTIIGAWPWLTKTLAKKISWLSHIPGIIVALVGATIANQFLNWPVETIWSRFGDIPNGLPSPTIPPLDWETAKKLFAPTLTIGLLGAIESLLCARVADNLSEDKHDPNQELMGQGIANIVVPFFGGLPVTGTIARTATNAKAGAQTPISGVIHSLVILLVMVVAAPLARNIPMATLAGILIFIAWGMFDTHEFKRLKQFNLTYRSILLGTFSLTLIFDLTVAVEVGLMLACIFFIYRISSLTQVEPIALPENLSNADELHLNDESPLPRVEAYKIYGSLFFGAVHKIESLYDPTDLQRQYANIIILEMHQLINIDTSAMDALNTLAKNLKKHDSQLIICAPNPQPESLMRRSGFMELIGNSNVVTDLDAAFLRAQEILEHPCK